MPMLLPCFWWPSGKGSGAKLLVLSSWERRQALGFLLLLPADGLEEVGIQLWLVSTPSDGDDAFCSFVIRAQFGCFMKER